MTLASTSPWVLPAVAATRTVAVAVFVLLGLRLFGKRQMGQMNIYDLAMVMALANAVQNAMTLGSGQLSAGMASGATLFVFSAVLAGALARWSRLERRVVGSPTLLVYEGRLLRERLQRQGVTTDEVMEAVREHGLDQLSSVLTATLEVDGSISVIGTDAAHRRHRRAVPARELGASGPSL
jgi:uncharacterized membrane protein YcaP (DUF421 family)